MESRATWPTEAGPAADAAPIDHRVFPSGSSLATKAPGGSGPLPRSSWPVVSPPIAMLPAASTSRLFTSCESAAGNTFFQTKAPVLSYLISAMSPKPTGTTGSPSPRSTPSVKKTAITTFP